jgi:biopolymer transport protein ExbB/TolQ
MYLASIFDVAPLRTDYKARCGIRCKGISQWERFASRLDRIEAAYGRRLLRATGILATIGAVAPFVGL